MPPPHKNTTKSHVPSCLLDEPLIPDLIYKGRIPINRVNTPGWIHYLPHFHKNTIFIPIIRIQPADDVAGCHFKRLVKRIGLPLIRF